MHISEFFRRSDPVISFEFFPPKTPEGIDKLFVTIRDLQRLSPAFVSVTCSSVPERHHVTLEMAVQIKRETGLETMAHLTCVGKTRDQIKRIVDSLIKSGVENVLALRGDPPQGEMAFVPVQGGFAYASELVTFLRDLHAPFCISAACYPEGHQEARDSEAEMRHLKSKVDAGVDFLITQLFFDNADYARFVQRVREIGISVPILPGIMPVTNYTQLQKFTELCGARIPAAFEAALHPVRDHPPSVAELGIRHALLQCRDLLARGAPGLHFYTLNASKATREIGESLQPRF